MNREAGHLAGEKLQHQGDKDQGAGLTIKQAGSGGLAEPHSVTFNTESVGYPHSRESDHKRLDTHIQERAIVNV